MKTINERRHQDSNAVKRQLKIAVSKGENEFNSQAARQPHRLNKSAALTVNEGDHPSNNPRRSAGRTKDKLTAAELGQIESYKLIEVPELMAGHDQHSRQHQHVGHSLSGDRVDRAEDAQASSRSLQQ